MTTEFTLRRRRSTGAVAAIVAAMMLLLVACSSSDSASESSGATPAADFATDDAPQQTVMEGDFDDAALDIQAMEAPDGDGADTAANFDTADAETALEQGDVVEESSDDESDLGSGGSTAVNEAASETGRKIIFTANLTVEVADVATAGTEATKIIEAEGGFLFGQETAGGPEAESILTFKVDPDRFDTALEKLGGVGELRNQTVSADDVTGPIVDLESRIGVAELGVERLKTALEQAPSLEDFAEIERLLIARESELAVMRGQIRTLQSQVDLATITVALVQDRVVNNLELTITAYEGFDNGAACPGEQSLRPEADSEVTICFDVRNSGDQTLTDIALTDTVLEIDEDTKLIAVFDTLDELAPGQSALVAFETVPDRLKTLRTRVTAVPTDGTSGEQVAPTVTANGSYELAVFGEQNRPGFGDGYSSAIDVLSELWVLAKVVVGFMLPMLIFLPFLWLIWRGLKARRRRRPVKPSKVATNQAPGTTGYPPVPAYGHQPPPPSIPVAMASSTAPIEPSLTATPDPSVPTEDEPEADD